MCATSQSPDFCCWADFVLGELTHVCLHVFMHVCSQAAELRGELVRLSSAPDSSSKGLKEDIINSLLLQLLLQASAATNGASSQAAGVLLTAQGVELLQQFAPRLYGAAVVLERGSSSSSGRLGLQALSQCQVGAWLQSPRQPCVRVL